MYTPLPTPVVCALLGILSVPVALFVDRQRRAVRQQRRGGETERERESKSERRKEANFQHCVNLFNNCKFYFGMWQLQVMLKLGGDHIRYRDHMWSAAGSSPPPSTTGARAGG